MSESDRLFDSLFPRSVGRFAAFNKSTARWHSLFPQADYYDVLFLLALADGLLVRAANWRNERNFFDSPIMWRRLLDFQRGIDVMAGKARSTKNWQDDKATWQGFLERRLTDSELEALDAWQPDAAEVWGMVDDMIQAGYRFTLSYNTRTKLATVTIIDDNVSRKTAGFALSTADGDGALALKAALYKHVTLLSGDWAALLATPPRGRRG